MIFLPDSLREKYSDEDIIFFAADKGTIKSLSLTKYTNSICDFTNLLLLSGIKRQDKIMTSLSHNFDWNIIEQSIFQIGAIHIPLAPSYLGDDISDKIDLIKPSLIITNSAFHFNKIQRILTENNLKIPLVPFSLKHLSINCPFNYKTVKTVDTDATALILFTSGSSMKSKAVALSYKNMLTSINDFSATDLFDGVKICLDILHHSFSGARKVNYSAQLRGIKICYANSTLSISENIALYKAELVTCVPYLAEEILVHLRQKKSLSSLKRIICGGAPLSVDMIKEFESFGISIYDVYGLTETSSLCTYNTVESHKRGSVGRFSKKISYKLNTQSELLVKGDSILKGYYTQNGIQKATDTDGWFNTHDIATIDNDGFLFLFGRSNGDIKSQKGKFSH